MKKLVLLITLVFPATAAMWACTCIYYIPTFCETITYGNNGNVHPNLLIVHGRVTDIQSDHMKVHILDILSGTTGEQTIRVRSGNGADCVVFVGLFSKNASYIFAFNGSPESDYILSECGVSFLSVNGDEINGPVAPGINRIRIADFPTLNDCGGIGSRISVIDVYPTLTDGEIRVTSTADIENISISVYDMLGRRVYKPADVIIHAAMPIVIPGSHFAAGCYAIVVEAQGVRRVFRVVVAA